MLRRRVAGFLRDVPVTTLRRMLMRPGWAIALATAAVLPMAHGQNDPVSLADVAAGDGGFVVNGINPQDFAGLDVSVAGDVNGDGLTDFILGAYEAEAGAYTNAGQSYVVFGKPDGAAISLTNVVAGTGGGFVINGHETSAYTGLRVSGAGDVNGDGLADLIVGRYGGHVGAEYEAGRAYVVFGKTGTASVELEDVIDGNGGFVINGIDAFDFAGQSVSGAGDVNGDGLGDVIVGAPSADPAGMGQAGESYVVFGKNDSLAVDLADVAAGYGGFAIHGIDSGDDSGQSVSGAGDVNGDGLDDVLVGAPDADPGGNSRAGEAYVVFGKTDGNLVQLSAVVGGTGGFAINGFAGGANLGERVSNAGDVNGDGYDDVIVGAWLASPGGRSRAGETYVVFGKTGTAAVELSTLAANEGGFAISGDDSFDASGYGVGPAGDMNGDGFDDVVVGAFGAAASAGESYVVFGKSSSTAVSLSTIATGSGGFIISGANSDDLTGVSVSGGGDVNGDGSPDIVVGGSGVSEFRGAAYVVFSPFPGNVVWVDFGHNGTEEGTFDAPFNDLPSAVAAVPAGGTIRILGSSTVSTTPAGISIDKHLTLSAFGGTVRIGGS